MSPAEIEKIIAGYRAALWEQMFCTRQFRRCTMWLDGDGAHITLPKRFAAWETDR